MEYIEKLQTMQENAKNIKNLSKEELIELVELLLKMSISQEKGYVYADELTQMVHKGEVESYQKSLVDSVESATKKIDVFYKFETLTGLKVDSNFINDIASGKIEIKLKG